MDYAVVSQAGHACITDPARIQQLYAEGGGASAASCCGQCELIWRMANQSLVPYLLQPLLTRWMDPASGSTVCASACRFELDLPRQTLRCECTLLISCTSEHGERDSEWMWRSATASSACRCRPGPLCRPLVSHARS